MRAISIFLLFFSLITASLESTEMGRLYFKHRNVTRDADDHLFYIHRGNNEWIVATTLIEDCTGLYAKEENILRLGVGSSPVYEKHWQCPYCHKFWPWGTPCQNLDCPSRFRD